MFSGLCVCVCFQQMLSCWVDHHAFIGEGCLGRDFL